LPAALIIKAKLKLKIISKAPYTPKLIQDKCYLYAIMLQLFTVPYDMTINNISTHSTHVGNAISKSGKRLEIF